MANSRVWRVLCGMALLATLVVPAAGQEATATITGVVSSQSTTRVTAHPPSR
ncbi:MAG: hypothetical protein ABIS06_07180 [Vicinamibacterales bacterium]